VVACLAWIGLGSSSESGVPKAPVLRRDVVVLLADDLRAPEVAGLLGRTNSGVFSADPDWNTLSSEKYMSVSIFMLLTPMLRCTFFGLTDLDFVVSSGSSSDGVGRTLRGVFVELFLGVFVVDCAGVLCAPVVDLLFLGDDLAGSS